MRRGSELVSELRIPKDAVSGVLRVTAGGTGFPVGGGGYSRYRSDECADCVREVEWYREQALRLYGDGGLNYAVSSKMCRYLKYVP